MISSPSREDIGLEPAVGLHIGRHHVPSVLPAAAGPPPAWRRSCRRRRRSRGRSSACPASASCLFGLGQLQHRLRGGAHCHRLSAHSWFDQLYPSARFRSKHIHPRCSQKAELALFGMGCDNEPAARSASACPRALATRGICTCAASGEMCGIEAAGRGLHQVGRDRAGDTAVARGP